MRYGMVIDLKRCLGCNSCTMACKQKNATAKGTGWAKFLEWETGTFPDVHLNYLPVLCNHCGEAPCVDVCPTGATQKLENGIVTVDANKCIGCRYCMVACPYGARTFNGAAPAENFPELGMTAYETARYAEHKLGTVEKCNFCIDRLEEGLEPACVQACPARARIFGDLDDPESEISQIINREAGVPLQAELGTDPSVFYVHGLEG